MSARLLPRPRPWPQEISEILSTYPQGPDGPIALFRTLAHSERTLRKVGAAGILDRASPLDKKHREILILRTSFRRSTNYEWGIHVVAFSEWAGLTESQVNNTCSEQVDPSLWTPIELLLIQVVDELSATSDVADASWRGLEAQFSTPQILEILMLIGFYFMIACFNNALRIEQEAGTPVFGEARLRGSALPTSSTRR
jgi:alkylhydroperoxidase family enzyme